MNASIWRWMVLLPIAAVLAWIFLAASRGDFVADDYVFIATGRMVDTPLAAFWQSHFYEPYYFRPIGVLSWWVATRLFDLNYAAHSAVNFLLHFANAALLFWLLRALALRGSAVAAGVFLFALGPIAVAAALWPSNRFDLLAVGFLLVQAIAMLHALRGSRFAFLLALLAALGAAWSKESAYVIATVMACVVLFASRTPWLRRLMLFAALGSAIGGAFFWRQHIVTEAFAAVSATPVTQAFLGALAWADALPRFAELTMGSARAGGFVGGVLAACLLSLVAARRAANVSQASVGAALLVFVATCVAQAPLAKAFAPMLNGDPFGTVTFARFYYAPWAALAVVVAVVIERGRFTGVAAATVVATTAAASMGAHPLAEAFAQWARREVKPMSVAATQRVDTIADGPCVIVLLGTQDKQPYFRMFSDATVKARSALQEKTWRCQVMTESTPWLFAFPLSVTPHELPLRDVPGLNRKPKPDSTWGGIRYRYRLPAEDAAKLPDARFFLWQDGQFVDVTAQIRSGARTIVRQDW